MGIQRTDLSGQKFGALEVIKMTPESEWKGKDSEWICKCKCGNTLVKRRDYIIGNHDTCGRYCKCKPKRDMSSQIKDLTGEQFGKLKIIKIAPKSEWKGEAYWICECECGNTITTSGASLRRGSSKTCGKCNKEATRICDYAGKTIKNITVLKRIENIGKDAAWLARCNNCGNEFPVSSKKISYAIKNNVNVACDCKNLIGKKFNRLTIISKHSYNEKTHQILWLCKCDCGGTRLCTQTDLKRGEVKSCMNCSGGHDNKLSLRIDHLGNKFDSFKSLCDYYFRSSTSVGPALKTKDFQSVVTGKMKQKKLTPELTLINCLESTENGTYFTVAFNKKIDIWTIEDIHAYLDTIKEKEIVYD